MTKKTSRTTPAKDKEPTEDKTLASILARKKRTRFVFTMELDAEAVTALAQAERRKNLAELAVERAPESEKVQKEITDALVAHANAKDAAEGATEDFVFEAIARHEMETLLGENRPTKDQIEEAKQVAKDMGRPPTEIPVFNPVTFPPILIAASSVEPKLTEAEASELWNSDVMSMGELQRLWAGVFQLNNVVV